MRVDTAAPTPRGSSQSPPRRDDDRPRPHGPMPTWQSVFGRAAAGPMPDAPLPFVAASAIGDAAMRFDARPIVAPVAERVADDGEGASSGDALSPTATHAPVPATATSTATALPADSATPSRPMTTANQVRANETRVSVPVTRDTAASSAPAAATLLPPSSMTPRPVEAAGTTTHIDRAERSAPMATQAATVRVAASADEVRILVPDAVLTVEDREALLGVATEALAGTSLAGRPIRIIARGERA